jgi:hypothetical protein
MKNTKLLSATAFREWTSLFSGEIFVKVVIYADESGTHDKTGAKEGSQIAIIAGFAAQVKTWVKFCKQWQATLSKFHAPLILAPSDLVVALRAIDQAGK